MPKRALRTSSLPGGLAAEMPSMKSQQQRRCKDPQICPRGWCSSASARARKRRENLRATRTLRLKTRRFRLKTADLQGSSCTFKPSRVVSNLRPVLNAAKP